MPSRWRGERAGCRRSTSAEARVLAQEPQPIRYRSKICQETLAYSRSLTAQYRLALTLSATDAMREHTQKLRYKTNGRQAEHLGVTSEWSNRAEGATYRTISSTVEEILTDPPVVKPARRRLSILYAHNACMHA